MQAICRPWEGLRRGVSSRRHEAELSCYRREAALSTAATAASSKSKNNQCHASGTSRLVWRRDRFRLMLGSLASRLVADQQAPGCGCYGTSIEDSGCASFGRFTTHDIGDACFGSSSPPCGHQSTRAPSCPPDLNKLGPLRRRLWLRAGISKGVRLAAGQHLTYRPTHVACSEPSREVLYPAVFLFSSSRRL